MDRLESQWGANTALLVFTDTRVVDDQLRTLHESFWLQRLSRTGSTISPCW
jgi:hypothetical protein